MMQPVGEVREVHASRVLVLAPHYDDEVLGCGGLLTRLAARAEVRVLFLSDGAGQVEDGDEADAYGRRRREEAEAVAKLLGFAGTEHLGLPDGSLAVSLEELTAAYRSRLLDVRPDLLLVPSPLEASPDHRAAFAALHRLLGGVREGDALAEAASRLRVLAYEVNHPLRPGLLVDVGEQVPRLEEAMALYSSQEERHGYLRAALGLRRFRTLSLAPEVEAAEAYLELDPADFATRSPAQLIRRLGGVPELLEVTEGPRVSVVVRTRNRPELLAEALESLAESTYRRTEVVLVNDGGAPPELAAGYPLPVTRVDLAVSRGRAGAANAGVEAASGDWIAFLDDDDLAAPEHLETLVGLAAGAGVRVAYTDAAVGVYELADASLGAAPGPAGWRCAERRLPYSRDFDPELLLLDNYIPFNTLLIERRLLEKAGPFDEELPFFEDWEMLVRLASKATFHHLARVTCEYRHFRGGGHHVFGERPSERADFLEVKARVLAKHRDALEPALVARAVDRLRRETVESAEKAARRGEELEEARRRLAERQEEYFRLNGTLKALEGDHQRLREGFEANAAEVGRLQGVERELRTALERHVESTGREVERRDADIRQLNARLEEEGAQLGRTYEEIRRLGALLETIEGSRLWRLRTWVKAKLG